MNRPERILSAAGPRHPLRLFGRPIRSLAGTAIKLLVALLIARPALAANTGAIRAGVLEAGYSSSTGITLSYDGVPIARRSTLAVVNRGWSQVYLDGEKAPAQVTTTSDAAGAHMDVALTSDEFDAAYHVDLIAGDKATVTLTGRLKRPVEAYLEYAAAYISADPIAGRPFHGITEGNPAAGTVAFRATSPDETLSRVLPPFQSLTIDSRVGPVTLDVSGERGPYTIFDARLNPLEWARAAPIFWCGLLADRALPTDRPITSTLTWQFTGPPPSARFTGAIQAPAGVVQSEPAVREPFTPPPHLVPLPRQFHLDTARFSPGRRVAITAGPGDGSAAQSLAVFLHRRFEITAAITRSPGRPGVRMTVDRRASTDNRHTRREVGGGRPQAGHGGPNTEPPAVPDRPEGYALQVTPAGAVVAGHDPAGTYYGVQTLQQLFGVDREGVYVQQGRVRDYPLFSFRGAHLFPSHAAFDEKLVERIFAHFKLNRLVLECEWARWPSHPELASESSPTMEDLSGIVSTARRCFVEPIPLINTLGHSKWIFSTGHHDNLKEDPGSNFNYDPTNPRTYPLIFDIFQDAIRVFRPRWFHIGHDEVTIEGRFPSRSAGPGVTATSLFVQDTRRLSSWLAQHNLTTMLWGDMLLGPGEAADANNAPTQAEAAARRKAMPPGAIIADWHYDPHPDYPSVGILQRSGFKVFASDWFDPDNIVNLSWSAYRQGALGTLKTTWSGISPDESSLQGSFQEYSAFVLAADTAWSPRPPAGPDYDPGERFRDAFDDTPVDRATHAGMVVDLEPLSNLALSGAAGGWVGMGPDHDLSTLPTGLGRWNGVEYRIASRAVALGGGRLPGQPAPQEIRIPIGSPVRAVHVLATTLWPGRMSAIASIVLENGTPQPPAREIAYHREMAPWTDLLSLPSARLAWQGHTRAGEAIGIREISWSNPDPTRPVRTLAIHCLDPSAVPVILAITLER